MRENMTFINILKSVKVLFILLLAFIAAQFLLFFINSNAVISNPESLVDPSNPSSPSKKSSETSDFWIKLPKLNKKKWGKTSTSETFQNDFGGYDQSEPGRQVRPPNVIGAGAKKCGTIAFSTFMKLNPQFRSTNFVEGHFLYKEKKFAKGLDGYSNALVPVHEHEISYEGTPRYLVESVVPNRVKAINETMKVIVVLCDPIKRLKSDFVHTTKTTEPHAKRIKSYSKIEDYILEYLPKIKNEMINNVDWLTDVYYHDIASSVITNGIYSFYLLHWLKYIPRENFLFLDGEAILKEPYKCMEDAQDFLNINQVLDEDHFYINEETGFYCAYVPGTHKTKTKCLPKYKGRTRNKEEDEYLHISDSTLNLLEEFYKPFNAQLCDIVGQKFSFFSHLC